MKAASVVAERIRSTIEKRNIVFDGNTMTVQVSIGVTQFHPHVDHSNKSLVERVDQALYRAKDMGRNRVEIVP